MAGFRCGFSPPAGFAGSGRDDETTIADVVFPVADKVNDHIVIECLYVPS
jgi:hypothetical protein